MRAFLGYCGVVDHQHGIAAADQPIRLNKQFRLHRPRIPDPGRDEVVQLIVFAKPKLPFQSDVLPTMVGPSKSRPPMSHRKTDLGIPCRSKSAKVVLN